ncbi:SIMPL domain-containing protein [Tenacibaculum agarivorans]|uniref:SIMPL domain-containing protein n=1 Tax=Tenacibaculum agarivorans TaxID=1908389 RepID=UPI000B135C7C|nr:SIMPL domain-containing protein [Tenacibaculum agarivorans]
MKIITTIFLLLTTTISFGQKTAEEKPYIEVTGTAFREVVPDEIYLDVPLEERIEKGKKITIQHIENKLKQELKTCGIPEEHLKISDLNSTLVKTGWWNKEILAKANYELKIQNTNHLKDIFEIFENLNIKGATITKATNSKIQRIKREVRILAIKAAKEKADYLLNAIGQKSGKPLIVNDVSSKNTIDFSMANVAYNRRKLVSNQTKNYTKNTIQFKNIEVSSSIYVKFEIQ